MIVLLDDVINANISLLRQSIPELESIRVLTDTDSDELIELIGGQEDIDLVVLDMQGVPWARIARLALESGIKVVLWSSIVAERWSKGERPELPHNCFGIWDLKLSAPTVNSAIEKFTRILSDDLRTDDEMAIGTGDMSVLQYDVIAPFSELKHRVAHCFLSIDVDLQGISVAKETNLEEAKEYLANVLWGNEEEPHKPLGYYVEKLKEARRLAGLEEGEQNTIQKILVDPDLLSNDYWICVKRLFGDGPIGNSPVHPLLATLDSLLGGGCCKIREEQLSILYDDKMETLVEYFSDLRKCWDECKTETEISWDFDECFVEGMSKYSFHDWFVSLNEALDKLRTALPV